MRLYIIRHGEPAYPGDALTARGHAQSRRLAARLATLGIDRVYSSPLKRARETAHYTAEILGLEVGVEPWLREIEDWWIPGGSGELPVWKVDGAVIRSLAPPLDWARWHSCPPFDAPHLASAFAQLGSASDAFLARHGCVREGSTYRLQPEAGRRLALFCHAGFALTWLAHLLALPPPLVWAGFALAPGSLTTVTFEEAPGGGAAPRCSALGDMSHLDAPGDSAAARPGRGHASAG